MSNHTTTAVSDEPLPWNTRPAVKNFSGDPLSGIEPRYLHKVNGRPVQFWTIGALAHVLGRKADTIRGWEEQGWLPRPLAVFSGRDPRNAASAKHGKRRLYTKAQILGIYQIAREEGVLEKHARPIQQTAFTARVKQLFLDTALAERAEDARKNGATS